MTFLKIICAVCHKPVDKTEWHDSTEKDARVVSVKCHGQVETSEIPFWWLMKGEVQVGNAFAKHLIETE